MSPSRVAAVALAGALSGLCAPPASADDLTAARAATEEIYILRSIREPQEATGWCTSTRAGFAPFPADAERFFSFYSVATRADGRLVDGALARVATLRGCFGPTDAPARQNFYAEVALDPLTFRGRGECLALMIDAPEPGLFPVRCQLVLDSLPPPYVGGLLTTNTLTSRAPFGGDTDPPGYTQASVATIRLWKRE